jgi:uncharacterized protein YbjT (DUF2867 family)
LIVDARTFPAPRQVIALTGATGYVGSRLAPELLARGHRVRCLVRSADKLRSRAWAAHPAVEIVERALVDEGAVREALRGCTSAYYLIHSMLSAGRSYAGVDRALALSFAHAARDAGVSRIIYLGGLGDDRQGLSRHLASRQEVELALRASGVPVTVLRAAMIIGSGSASFEILRYLVERLPIMITPRWVRTESQPIAVSDVITYLADALEEARTIGRTLDIGGPDVVTYSALMRIMAVALRLPRRLVIPVPVLTPRLSALWIFLVTPISGRIARPLAEGLRNRVVCRSDEAARLMPHRCLTVREAIDAALGRAGAAERPIAGAMAGDPAWAGGTVFVDRREVNVAASRAATWHAVCSLGGERGYFRGDWLWRLRGMMDRLVGGPGMRRGRRSVDELRQGDEVDFWRVSEIEAVRRLVLTAEMKLPGTATLGFDIEDDAGGERRCRLVMTARFRPRGLLGIAYWWAVVPLHFIAFRGMLRGLAREAERAERLAPKAAPAVETPPTASRS